jgi:hypothetical protein
MSSVPSNTTFSRSSSLLASPLPSSMHAPGNLAVLNNIVLDSTTGDRNIFQRESTPPASVHHTGKQGCRPIAGLVTLRALLGHTITPTCRHTRTHSLSHTRANLCRAGVRDYAWKLDANGVGQRMLPEGLGRYDFKEMLFDGRKVSWVSRVEQPVFPRNAKGSSEAGPPVHKHSLSLITTHTYVFSMLTHSFTTLTHTHSLSLWRRT